MNEMDLLSLQWLGRQSLPMWGGHLGRKEPISHPQIRTWIADGIIEAVEKPRPGYVLTDKGRAAIYTAIVEIEGQS
jgi:hypothetical protein